MSIIADTLKRLKNRSTGTPEGMTEEPSRQSTFNQGEGTGQHRKNSPMKFWIIGTGITVGLGGLAISAFWIGLHLDFGLSANTHALMANNRPLPTLPLPAEIQNTTQKSSELVASTEREITQPSSTLTAQPIAPTPKSTTLIESSQQQEARTPQRAASKKSHQSTFDTSRSRKPEDSQITHPVAVPLKKEIRHTKKLRNTAKLSTNPPHTSLSRQSLKRQQKAMNTEAHTPAPQQPSTAHQLRHAQQLIQTGQYEEAVVLLSPLFHELPVKWQPWFWMGTALLGQEDLEQADQFFLNGLARNDKIPQLWIQRALVAQQRGNYQLAIHELRQAESLKADLPHIHLNMGYAYEQLGNDRLAKQYYEKFLKFSEGKPEFFSTRKKLFAHVTRQTQTEKRLPPSASSLLDP